ncbi:glutamate 5-kinase [bacterium]|nr:MAG: glutamate 5-kinase [bacterium]
MSAALPQTLKRIVVKLGSQVLTDENHNLRREVFEQLADDVKWLKEQGKQVVIVTSGAVAAGRGRLGFSERTATIPEKQALAAVGQLDLMWTYREVFGERGMVVGQVLLTGEDLRNRSRHENASNTLTELFSRGVVPVINENDTVVVKEIKFGDNDNLSSLVANLVEADCLVILSDVEGLYDKDPKEFPDAKLVPCVEAIDGEILGLAGKSKSKVGTGGMSTKLSAAMRAQHAGAYAVIASGKIRGVLRKIFSGENIGTLFIPGQSCLNRKKHWIAYTVETKGAIVIDTGAASAITVKKKSLLPKGIVAVSGEFSRNDGVSIANENGEVVAKGLTRYSSSEIRKIAGLSTTESVERLGDKYYSDEVVHRDDLVVLG